MKKKCSQYCSKHKIVKAKRTLGEHPPKSSHFTNKEATSEEGLISKGCPLFRGGASQGVCLWSLLSDPVVATLLLQLSRFCKLLLLYGISDKSIR